MLLLRLLHSATNAFVDRAIGADGLSVPVREKLLKQQLDSIGRMVPALLATSLILSPVLVLLVWGRPRAWAVLALLCAASLILLWSSLLATRVLRSSPGQAPSLAGQMVLSCFLAGTSWACALALLPSGLPGALQGAAIIGAGGLLCISMMALINYPQAMGAFTVPLIVGMLSGFSGLGQSGDMLILSLMLTGLTFVTVTITFNHAAAFVALRTSETLVEEKQEIIGLLLREFEQTTSDWIWGIDLDGTIDRLSGGFTAVTGLSEEDLIGADFLYFLRCITPPADPVIAQIEHEVLARQTFQDVELQVLAGGEESWWRLTGKPAFDDTGRYLGYLGTGSDITVQKRDERRITMLAHHDSLTGLLNRAKFNEFLALSVGRLERYGSPFTVLYMDLDQFKLVNDSRGHLAGDRLLFEVARRIEKTVREGDLVARLGGDEFALILPDEADVEAAQAVATRLIEAICQPVEVDGGQMMVGVSIGIAIAPLHGTRPDQILRNADLALYRAKTDGRSVFRMFESRMDSEARERRLLENELTEAVGKDQLVLHYQPLVDAETGAPTGFEALVRWNHPVRGLIPPAEFIPLAEQSHLIIAIGDWTIHQACLAATQWPEHLTVAVNLSARHFRQSDIGVVVNAALAQSGLKPNRLEIEITEGLLIEEPEAVVEKLQQLRALGVTIAMDDFGTGYSSLGYLLKFPFDKIKIDRSFVEASAKDSVARDILRAIATLGKILKVKITAEGVETAEQAAFLSEIACHQLQGFYFARPLDPRDMPHYLLSTVPTRAPDVAEEARRALRASA
ncbi:EAL domain-containing protein [Devosia sp. PTR5]|uniref:EAL domain-containing protein n=1 Tax=Devosia oryzisoli TaxID=2774138 RepID=A0A927FUT8_9HYPH|nr:GGDEF and EAL domain-containing protein [Devosia oryzisoli]MBD8066700.1 EAL domain-containing protein [Devosia oryzisoli]